MHKGRHISMHTYKQTFSYIFGFGCVPYSVRFSKRVQLKPGGLSSHLLQRWSQINHHQRVIGFCHKVNFQQGLFYMQSG